MDRYSNLRCGALQLLRGYLWSLCCLSDLMPPLPWLGVFVGFYLLAGLWCHILSIFNNGFNGALWDVQSFRYFFITQPDLYFPTTLSMTCLESSLVFMVSLAWLCPLLSGVADSGAFQNSCTVYTVEVGS